MKRIFSVKRVSIALTALTMVLTTACSSGGAQKTATDAPKASGDKKVLNFWYIDPGEKEKVYQEAAKRFEAKHPDAEVKLLRIPNDAYKQKLAVSMSGGNPPDVFHSWGGGWLKQFVDSGKVLDMTGKIDTSHYLKTAMDNATFNGKVYGAPLGLSLTAVFYNKEMFQKYNLQVPTTWEQFLADCDTLKKNNIIPLALANQTKWPGAYYLVLMADRIGSPDLFNGAFQRTGKSFDDPDYVKTGQYIQELVKKGYFNPGFNGIPYDAGQSRQLLYTGQAAMSVMSNSFINNIRQESPDYEKKVGFFNWPAMPGGKGDPSDVNAVSAPVWSAAANTKYPDLAEDLIKELTSDQTAKDYEDRTASVAAVKGVESKDPFVKQFAEMADKAKYIQWPYDQTLPPELAQVHLDTTQALFGLSMTPEEAAKKMEDSAKSLKK